jgi:hypothetical protein
LPDKQTGAGRRLEVTQQAGLVLRAAHRGPRRTVHVQVPAETLPEPATIGRLHSAGADIVSFCLPAAGTAKLWSRAVKIVDQALAISPASVGIRVTGLPDGSVTSEDRIPGVSYIAGGPLQALTAARRREGNPVGAALDFYRILDEWCASTPGPGVVRQVDAPPAAAPPPVLLRHQLAELSLCLSAGARALVLDYPAAGNLVRDVAAVRAMRSLAIEQAISVGTAEILTSVSIEVGPADSRAPANGYARVSAAAIAAGLSDADQVLVSSGAGAAQLAASSALDAVVDAVAAARQMLDMLAGQELELSDELLAEEASIVADVRANRELLARTGSPVGEAITAAVASGQLLGSELVGG